MGTLPSTESHRAKAYNSCVTRNPDEPDLDGSGLALAVVVSRFNQRITARLLAGAREALERHGVAHHEIFFVPGSYISRVDPTGYPAWQSGEKGGRLLSTRLGIDATRPLDPSFPEVAEPPRSMWTQINLSEYLR